MMPLDFPTTQLPAGRVRLEILRREHASDLLAALDQDRVWEYIPWARPRSHADMLAYIDSALLAHASGGEIPISMIDTLASPGPRVVGTSRLTDISHKHRNLEIGWTMISPACQRTCVNTEAKLMMLTFAFDRLDLAPAIGASTRGCVRVQLKCDGRNVRSQNAILRIGASFEGRLRKHRIMPDGFLRDTMMYSITDDDWPRVKAHLNALLNTHAE